MGLVWCVRDAELLVAVAVESLPAVYHIKAVDSMAEADKLIAVFADKPGCTVVQSESLSHTSDVAAIVTNVLDTASKIVGQRRINPDRTLFLDAAYKDMCSLVIPEDTVLRLQYSPRRPLLSLRPPWPSLGQPQQAPQGQAPENEGDAKSGVRSWRAGSLLRIQTLILTIPHRPPRKDPLFPSP
jgi:hypothetical protein